MLRIAGPGADAALRALGANTLPAAREARLVRLSDPQDGQPIDQALVLRFPGPASFTGDDVVEIHHHGGLGVRRMLASVLMRAPGLRPAEAGEFTRRAFLNGKLDLSEVVGLGDLIDATTARAARSALLRLEGGLSRKVADWGERLLDMRAGIEAEIDFSADQSDVTAGAIAGALPALLKIQSELSAAWTQGPTASRLRDGFRVAVIGAPNVGKSSLVNLLAGRDVAIVTDRPGTTRDAIEVDLDLDGLPVTLIDTAGLRETEDPIEREGIQRARDKAAGADLVLELVDGSQRDPLPPGQERHLVVANKSDLCPAPLGVINISCRTGDGISALLQTIALLLNAELPEEAGAVPTDAHGQAAIGEALGAVDRALEAISMREPVLVADELRQAAIALGRITGTGADPEDVLGAIFARFCIGK